MNQRRNTNIFTIKEKHEEDLLALEDVHAVSIGYKIVDDVITDTLSIVIHTTDKKDKECVPTSQMIPCTLEGVPTDVVESPPFEILPIEFEDSVVEGMDIDDKKYRPVPGGVEIYMPTSSTNGGIGTLGMYAISVKQGESYRDLYLLTNAHCLPAPNQVVRQPESNNPEDTIANATRIINSEVVDGGIAKMINPGEADPFYIEGIGVPTGELNVTIENLNEPVIKRGRTTRITRGFIAYIDVTLTEKKHQIVINSDMPFAAPGDSGSVVLIADGENKDRVIGLLWGGASTYAILSPIEAVTTELEIELLTRQIQLYYLWR